MGYIREMSELLPAHTKSMKDLEERVALFKKAQNRQQLAEALGYNYNFFVFFLFAKDIERHYVEFNIAKNYKADRLIAAPNEKLKLIQKNLADILLFIFKPKKCVHAFVKDKNIVTNARPHLKAHHVLRLDLKDFFPSIHFGRVRNLFEAEPFNFSREISTTIAKICCYKGKLPQGAPTSPIISNMICLRMDAQLTRLSRDNSCNYTRYADDITFSTNKECFSKKIVASLNPLTISDVIIRIIKNNYFDINFNKVNIRSNNDSKFITGVKVNSKLNVSRKKYREVRAILHALRTHGHDKALEEHIAKYSKRKRSIPQTNFYNIVQGKIAFLGMVRGGFDPIVSKLKIQLEQIQELDDKKINKRLIEKAQSQLRDDFALILCEGKTDRIYLSFALRKLRNKGLFKDLKLLFYVWTSVEGCSAGENDLGVIARKGLLSRYSTHPKIYIFDRDIKKPNNYVNTVETHEAPKHWGENTWSFLLHEPSFRSGYGSSISIEHFFADQIIFSPDKEGRTLYCCSQFDEGTPKTSNGVPKPDTSTNNSNQKMIFKLISDSEVYFEAEKKKGKFALLDDKIQKGEIKNIARSKFSLAKEVVKSDIISDESLEEFEKIFLVIESIIEKSKR